MRGAILPTPASASLPGHPGYQLAVALTHLHRTSALSGRGLAIELGLSPSLLARIMLGNRTPKWPVVQRFAELCQASPTICSLCGMSVAGRSSRPTVSTVRAGGHDGSRWMTIR